MKPLRYTLFATLTLALAIDFDSVVEARRTLPSHIHNINWPTRAPRSDYVGRRAGGGNGAGCGEEKKEGKEHDTPWPFWRRSKPQLCLSDADCYPPLRCIWGACKIPEFK